MNDTSPSFLRRRGSAKAVAIPDAEGSDPDVVAFLSRVKATGDENKDLRAENEALNLGRDHDLGRINLLQHELHRTIRQRDGYQRAYAEQKAEIVVLITAAEVARNQAHAAIQAAFDAFVQTSTATLRAIKESLVDEGVDPIEPRETGGPLTDQDMKKIANSFGGDSRPAEEESDR